MALTTREQDFSERYNELVVQAGLAQNSAVRGCMIIKPYGYAIRENMQKVLDHKFKETGHVNAYFPLFIPKSFLSKEAAHVDGFAKECAVVTHHRLKLADDGKSVIVDPEAKLEEELIVRPTSETIIWSTYKDWINSYRDLPLLINQRANVVRREMRTRIFLRTTEFLWQEGHTAHATAEEALTETKKMLDVYDRFSTELLAISSVKGKKTENEKFAGAIDTYCIEAMMQDGKALQAGTSHFLGQNFAKAFDVTFTNKQNEKEYVWATSRGVTTRLIGALIMSHSDDKGLVIPPAIAPIHLVIVPIYKTDEELETIKTVLQSELEKLENTNFKLNNTGNNLKLSKQLQLPITIKIDEDPGKSMGRKFNERELKGVPLRIGIGARDITNGTVEVFRRDTQTKEIISITEIAVYCEKTLYEIQSNLLNKNKKLREENTVSVNTYEEFKQQIENGKFILAHRDGTTETEKAIKEETKATIRCIPSDSKEESGTCIYSGKPSKQKVLFAKAY